MKNKNWIFITGIVLGLLVILLVWGLPRLKPHTFTGTLLQSPSEAHNFTLYSSNGRQVSLEDYRGKLVMLYFGYTFCPDVCPASLAEASQALKILGDDAKDVQLIMISVDPERDSPSKTAEYVKFFHPDYIGVTGSAEEIAEVATLYGIFYQKNEGSEATDYLVDHTATITVVDQKGHVKLVFAYGTEAEDIAADLKYLLEH